MKFETMAIHVGQQVDPATGAVAVPIHPSSTYERAPDGDYPLGFEYSRSNNPTRENFETCMAALEGGAGALAFSSGMAAATTLIEALMPAGSGPDRPVLLMPEDMYHGVRTLMTLPDMAARFRTVTVTMSDPDAVALACRECRPALVWLETPSNPLITVTDIAAVSAIAHGAGARVVVDNTFASPALQRPLALGADHVMHSATKYIGGHSDLMAGVVVSRDADDRHEALRTQQNNKGAVPSPFDCWLALRGLHSLSLRMQAHCRNAETVAEALDAHPKVIRVHYPGLPTDPGHALARAQMAGFGGMLSFIVPGGRETAFAVAARLKLILRATSLGGTHSLIEHRASIEGPRTRAPEGLLRLSIGIEHADDLIEDLTQALEVVP